MILKYGNSTNVFTLRITNGSFSKIHELLSLCWPKVGLNFLWQTRKCFSPVTQVCSFYYNCNNGSL